MHRERTEPFIVRFPYRRKILLALESEYRSCYQLRGTVHVAVLIPTLSQESQTIHQAFSGIMMKMPEANPLD